MKLINLLNAANVIVPKKDVRFYLMGVALYISNDELVAVASTDGHRLLVLTVDNNTSLADCNVTIINKNDVSLINLKYSNLSIDELTSSNSINNILNLCEKINGTYPDIVRVIPKKDRIVDDGTVGLDLRYLSDTYKIHTQLTKGLKNKFMPHYLFSIGDRNNAITASKTLDKIDVLYVQMPNKIK